MSSPGDSRATTFRLSEATKNKLEHVASVLRHSQTQVVEEALTEYFKNHGFTTRYVMSVSGGHTVLMKLERETATVLDVQETNGLPPQKVAEKYAARYNSPVDVIVEGEEGP